MIPHYTFSGHHYPYNILEDSNINEEKSYDELLYYVNNVLLKENKKEIKDHLDKELDHIKELDELSDIKCYNFIKDNYKDNLLFFNRSYPTSHLIHFMAKQI